MAYIDSIKEQVKMAYSQKFLNYAQSADEILIAINVVRHKRNLSLVDVFSINTLSELDNNAPNNSELEKIKMELPRLLHYFGNQAEPSDKDNKLSIQDKFILDALKFRVEDEVYNEIIAPLVAKKIDSETPQAYDEDDIALHDTLQQDNNIDERFLERTKTTLYCRFATFAQQKFIPSIGEDILWDKINPTQNKPVFTLLENGVSVSPDFLKPAQDYINNVNTVIQNKNNSIRTRFMATAYSLVGAVVGIAIGVILSTAGLITIPAITATFAPIIVPIVFAAIFAVTIGVALGSFGVLVAKLTENKYMAEDKPQATDKVSPIPTVSSALSMLKPAEDPHVSKVLSAAKKEKVNTALEPGALEPGVANDIGRDESIELDHAKSMR